MKPFRFISLFILASVYMVMVHVCTLFSSGWGTKGSPDAPTPVRVPATTRDGLHAGLPLRADQRATVVYHSEGCLLAGSGG